MRKLYKILLIDDDEIFNLIHKRLLENLEIAEKIEVALNGKEALRYFDDDDNIPELVFVDLNMPIMNGFQFLHEIQTNYRNNFEKSRFIILTSSSDKNDINKAKEYKISDYIIKPITIEKIKEIFSR